MCDYWLEDDFKRKLSIHGVGERKSSKARLCSLPSLWSEDDEKMLDVAWNDNPFKFPKKKTLLALVKEHKREEDKLRRGERVKKCEEKETFRSRSKGKTLPAIRHMLREMDIEELKEVEESKHGTGLRAMNIQKVFPKIGTELSSEFVQKKRETFLYNLALQGKRDEMTQTQQLAIAEENKLKQKSKQLTMGAARFQEFLKNTDEVAVAAVNEADAEAKKHQETTQELRWLSAKLVQLKNELSFKDEELDSYFSYKSFLLLVIHNLNCKRSQQITVEEWNRMRVDKYNAEQSQRQLQQQKTASVSAEKRSTIDRKQLSAMQRTHSTAGNIKRSFAGDSNKIPESLESLNRTLRADGDRVGKSHEDVTHKMSTDDSFNNRRLSKGSAMVTRGSRISFQLGSTHRRRTTRRESLRRSTTSPPQMVNELSQRELEDKRFVHISKNHYPEEWLSFPVFVQRSELDFNHLKTSLDLNNPGWLLDVIHELEEHNIQLITQFQYSDEMFEEIKALYLKREVEMNAEVSELKRQLDRMNEAVVMYEDRIIELEVNCQMLDSELYGTAQEQLDFLSDKVEQVYQVVIGKLYVNFDSLVLLTQIESKCQELLDEIEKVPEDILVKAQRDKEKERRQQVRELRKVEERLRLEERARRARKRSLAQINRRRGRKLMRRSSPHRKTFVIKANRLSELEKNESVWFLDAEEKD